MTTVYDFSAKTLDGGEQSLGEYRGQVLLIVNVASKCGFTPQYAALEALYRKLKDRQFSVLGFPCNQFGQQEPGTEEEIQEFTSKQYAVTFPLFAKVAVNGPDAHPLFQHLRKEASGILTNAIKWNFTKFLIDREGKVVRRYAPQTTPQKIESDIVALL